MNTKNDGGPVYPVPRHENHWGDTVPHFYCMSLRDYFAAKAMQALLREDGATDGHWYVEAKAAYEIADAMLLEREAA